MQILQLPGFVHGAVLSGAHHLIMITVAVAIIGCSVRESVFVCVCVCVLGSFSCMFCCFNKRKKTVAHAPPHTIELLSLYLKVCVCAIVSCYNKTIPLITRLGCTCLMGAPRCDKTLRNRRRIAVVHSAAAAAGRKRTECRVAATPRAHENRAINSTNFFWVRHCAL